MKRRLWNLEMVHFIQSVNRFIYKWFINSATNINIYWSRGNSFPLKIKIGRSSNQTILVILIDTGLNDDIARLNIGYNQTSGTISRMERPKTNILEIITLTKASTSIAFRAVYWRIKAVTTFNIKIFFLMSLRDVQLLTGFRYKIGHKSQYAFWLIPVEIAKVGTVFLRR